MKKPFIAALVLITAFAAQAQTVTLDFTVGQLTQSDGTTPIADGSLIQILAAPTTGDFSIPTPTEFISGSEIMLWSGAFDSSTLGTAGAMAIAPAPIPTSTLPAGYSLLVQWFPTLLSTATTPGYGTWFGQFSTANDVTWVSPAAGASETFTFLTVAVGGANANSLGSAMQMTAVPEPSTYALLAGIACLGFMVVRRRMALA